MRISDWSSDVCSSDLRPGAVRRRAGAGARAVRGGRPRSRPGPGASGLGRAGPFDLDQLPVDAPAGVLDRVADRAQLFQRRAIAMLLQPKALAQHFLHGLAHGVVVRSEEQTSELQSLMRLSYAAFRLTKKKDKTHQIQHTYNPQPTT